MSTARRVVRNSLFGLASEAIGGALSFLVVILIARDLGSAQFGVFSYVLAFTGVFQLVADFGLTNILVKEIARDRARAQEIVGRVKPLVWLFSLLILGLIVVLAQFVVSAADTRLAMGIMGAAVLATFHAVVYGSVCRAFEQMGYNAWAFVSHKVVLLALVLAAMHFHWGMAGMVYAYLIANVYQWAFYYTIVRVRFFRTSWHVDLPYWRHLLAEAFPVGVAMIFRRATLHVDTLLLTAMSTSTAVGLFNAAYRLIQIVDMIPFTLAIPLFPAFSRLARGPQDKLREALEHALRIFMMIAMPLATWVLLAAPSLVELAFGKSYLAAADTLRILSGAVLFLFPTALYIYLFSALDKQKYYTISSAACLALNAVVDVALIPPMGYLGAAIGTLSAEVVFFLVGAALLARLGFPLPWLRLAAKPVIAAAVAAAAAILLTGGLEGVRGLVLNGVVFFGCYAAVVLLLRVVSKEDIVVLRMAMRREAEAS
jgi:O-antigen/teichoic acid export membrane protein